MADQHITEMNDTNKKKSSGISFINRIANLKIGYRIYGGFALVLAAIVFMAGQAVFQVDKLGTSFDKYGDMSSDAILVIEIEAALEEVQLKAREYMAGADEEKKKEFDTAYHHLEELVGEAKGEIHKPERAELIANIAAKMGTYKTGFDRIAELIIKRNGFVYDTLNPVGLNSRKHLTEIREGAFNAGDYESASFAGIAQEHLLLARLYVLKFLDTNDDAAVDRAVSEFEKLSTAMDRLGRSLENPGRRQLLGELRNGVEQYKAAFAGLVDVIHERNKIRAEVLDTDAAQMIADAKAVDASAVVDQEALLDTTILDIGNAKVTSSILAAITLIAGILCAFFIGRGITRPVINLTGAMQRLAEGDNDAEIPGMSRSDEIGAMARTLGVFKQNAIDKEHLEAQSAEEQRAREARAQATEELIKGFDSTINSVLLTVGQAVESVEATTGSLLNTAEQTTHKATTAAAASEEASTNASTVAGASEELSSTINEVNGQVERTSQAAQEAKQRAEATNGRIGELSEAAQQIGGVVQLISEIAEQTNLLALNATIEAARAGDAGKGFAVVASEVKDLASQTAKATEEISSHIDGIRNVTNDAVEAMQGISDAIDSVNTISASVAAAMEEQQSATAEIARSIQEAAAGTTEVSENITGVSQAANETTESANMLKDAASQLSEQSDIMKKEIEGFLTNVRAA